MGIKEKILRANTVDEINTLLNDGSRFEYVSIQTRNAWVNAAKRRAGQLDDKDKLVLNIKKTVSSKVINKKPQKKKRHNVENK